MMYSDNCYHCSSQHTLTEREVNEFGISAIRVLVHQGFPIFLSSIGQAIEKKSVFQYSLDFTGTKLWSAEEKVLDYSMGSEQSSQQGKAVRSGLRRGKSVPEYRVEEENKSRGDETTGTISPEPSVCSDSDLPYISYTVNRPIGDSPKKKPSRKLSRGKSGSNSTSSRKFNRKIQIPLSKTGHNIVVVNEASAQPSKSNDPDLLKLQSIPQFLPIMRATLSVPAARDPEVLERLDSTPLCHLCHLYQKCLNKNAVEVATEQDKLSKQMIAIDKKSNRVVECFHEKQKIFAKHAENFSKINEIVQQVEKCNLLLKETVLIIQRANDALPEDLKLEPFAWTTG